MDKLNKRILYSLVTIFAFSGLSRCSTSRGTQQTLCVKDEVVAVIQSDGNVYAYDLCKFDLIQLTQDGQSYDKQGGRQEGTYYFFDSVEAWAPDGSKLVVGKNFAAYVIDLHSRTVTPLGDRVMATLWSPDSRYIATVEIPKEQHHIHYDPLPYNTVSVIDTRDFSTRLSFAGNAPVWATDSELIYFSVVEELPGYILHKANMIDLEGHGKVLSQKATTINLPLRYSRLSANKRYAAIYSPEDKNLGVLSLRMTGTFSVEWYVKTGDSPTWYVSNAYHWSPTKPLLAICNDVGGLDAPPPETAGGAVLLVEFDHPTKIFDQKRCASWSQVTWNSKGDIVAFLNEDQGLSFIDVNTDKLIDVRIRPEDLKIDKGPWWSPDGTLIGAVVDGEVCIAKVEDPLASLQFECSVEGLEMAWKR